MQKILISTDLMGQVQQGDGLHNRADLKIFTAFTTDEILKIHIEETVNLIILKHDLPGTNSENIFDIIWHSQLLKKVHVVMICEDDASQRATCKRCGAHIILTMPVDPGLIHKKVQQFLSIARRKAYRVTLSVSVEGNFKNRPFLCHTENISSSGALISAKFDLSLGDNISCSFYLPDMTKIDTKCVVVRVMKQEGADVKRYGIKYTKISAEGKTRIETYIDSNRT
jgi:hypothetical protein